jgi:CubicO group peptidase (beta-lactamase class C family)
VDWQTSIPELQGMSSVRLQEMEEFIQLRPWGDDIISLLIIRGGYLIYENYFGHPESINIANEIHSDTKSVTSALVGIALGQGLIGSVYDYVLDYFPDRTFANMSAEKEAITIEHLLSMTSGLPWDEWTYPFGDPRNDYNALLSSPDWVQWLLDRSMQYAPGEEFHYNTGGSHLLSAIVSAASGMNTTEFADQFLFSPLGITYWWWPGDPQGAAMGGSDLYLRPRDMAKIGYLYLRGGIWAGQTIVPTWWVINSTTSNRIFDPLNAHSDGYAYQWWTYPYLNAYCARGFLGQYIWVIPSQDLVVVITGNSHDIADVTLVENYILPAITGLSSPLGSPPIVLAIGIGVGTSIAAVLIILYRRRRKSTS